MQKSFFSFSLYLLQTLQYFLSFRDCTGCALSRYSNACRHTGNAECPDRILFLQILRNEVSGIGISGSGGIYGMAGINLLRDYFAAGSLPLPA